MPKDKYQIRFLKIAEEDFTEIVSYIAADNPRADNVIATKIEKNLELISENPLLGKIPKDEEIRKLRYRFLMVQNHIVFYMMENKTIYIYRILHSAIDYKSIL